MKKLIMCAALMCLTGTAHAAMDVATFLQKADALKAKGPLALFSSDLRLLKSEMETAGKQLRSEKQARDKAGLPPRSCPPKDAKPMTADQFLAEMHKLSPADQRLPLKDGLLRVAQRRFPCS